MRPAFWQGNHSLAGREELDGADSTRNLCEVTKWAQAPSEGLVQAQMPLPRPSSVATETPKLLCSLSLTLKTRSCGF